VHSFFARHTRKPLKWTADVIGPRARRELCRIKELHPGSWPTSWWWALAPSVWRWRWTSPGGGVDVLVLETRRRGEPPSVKCNHVAARTMEMFRRLGAATKVREAGLPADYPNDVAYRTAFLGTELTACSDTLPGRPLQRDQWTRHLVADARAAAPDQSRSISSRCFRASGSPAWRPRPQPHVAAGVRAERGSRHRASDRPQFRPGYRDRLQVHGRLRRRKLHGAQGDRRQSLAVIPSCRGCSRPISARPICYRCCARGAARRHGHPSP